MNKFQIKVMYPSLDHHDYEASENENVFTVDENMELEMNWKFISCSDYSDSNPDYHVQEAPKNMMLILHQAATVKNQL